MKVIVSQNQKIQGLITKDLLQLSSYKIILITSILVFAILSIVQTLNNKEFSLYSIFPIITIFIFELFFIASFNYDEASKSDRYIKSMPVSTKEIISAKYFLAIILNVIAALIGIIITIFLVAFFDTKYLCVDFPTIISATFVGIVGISILESIQIPFIYKVGAEKARMQMFLIIPIIIAVLAIVIGGILYWIEKLEMDMWSLKGLTPLLLSLLTIFVYRLSYKVSCKIYDKKEV
ncbi:MAG: ABC-2 transporter permease [Clostridia bacterium]|nr:ABC-2 transporter permease [Clostridia bacterium]